MEYSKVRGFHWLTWTVIGLSALLLAGLAVAIVYQSNVGIVVGLMAGILQYVFLLVFIGIVACIIGGRLKAWLETWLERYLDALVEQKSKNLDAGAKLAVLNEKIEGMKDKIDRIEGVLVKISEQE
ncbi:hypothetical protein L21_2007 [Methanoculleus chikugoensis]|uniref:Uncharacterized protein n=1 Tax=Methanoculleus chikugoensis TaxID=118126 RepID=A0A1M4MMI8_9EURY|nr:hypothetical protein [Methanoculleus chikugoensis]SCL76086.1 hypothetical protein L21_2007 [Methanoculleus chikugoensis]